jgi:hypothetical protein
VSVWYATREDVMSALDVAESARSVAQIDRLIEAASRSVEAQCHRKFYPTVATRYLDWPTDQLGTSYRLYLDGDHELISITTLTSNAVALTSYFLEPQGSGPPYTRIELDRASSDAFGGSTAQRAVTISGVFGACADLTLIGSLAEALDASETSVDATAMSVGIGDHIKIDSEYMQVTGRSLLTTGATLTAALAASPNAAGSTFALSGTWSISPGEVLTIDGERMLVTAATATTVTVERAWSGSVLAAHALGATVYAPRSLTVHRGQLGTTAATHADTTAVYRHTPPPLVRTLTVAEALVALQREQSGYARTVGADGADRAASGGDLRDLRDQVYWAHGRTFRKGVV